MTDCAPAELILAGALRAVARRDRDETSARVALSGTPSACSAAGGSSVATVQKPAFVLTGMDHSVYVFSLT